MGDLLEIVIWICGFALVHEGVAQRSRGHPDKRTKFMILTGILILIAGASLWFLNARAYHKLGEALGLPTMVEEQKELSAEKLGALPVPQRREASIRWARAAFVAGGELLSVVTEDGNRVPYSPDSADVKARDRQLKSLHDVRSQRQALTSSESLAHRESERWLASLLIALFTGVVARHSRFRYP